MTPAQISEARKSLGLTQYDFGRLLGYTGNRNSVQAMVWTIEVGKKRLRDPQRRLIQAYLAGYRPDDWP